jgi:hypothetical protein
MGLFSNPCTNPDCDGRVPRNKRFCEKCGTSGARGWTRCPNCKERVAITAEFCTSCRNPMNPGSREGLAGGRWQRPVGVIAERFNVDDVNAPLVGRFIDGIIRADRTLERGLIVEPGTVAIVLDGGGLHDVLTAGQYNVDSLAHRWNHWGNPPPRSVILIESGDIVLQVEETGLRDATEIPLDFRGEVVIRLREGQQAAEEFLTNMFKRAGNGGDGAVRARSQLLCENMQQRLAPAIRNAVSEHCGRTSIEDLIKDPQRRLRLEDALRQVIGDSLAATGFEVVRVPAVEFTGVDYERQRQLLGEFELKRMEFEYNQRMREALAADRSGEAKDGMTRAKLEHELEEYVAQLAQEKDVGQAKRDQDLRLLKQLQIQELDRNEALYAREQEMARLAHEMGYEGLAAEHKHKQERLAVEHTIAVDGIQQGHRRDQRAKDGETGREERLAELEVDRAEAEVALDLKRKKRALEREDMAEALKIKRVDAVAWGELFEGRDLQEIIALHPNSSVREHLLSLYSRMQKAGLSAEQMLAVGIADSPAAPEALKELVRAGKDDLQDQFDEKKAMMDEFAARLQSVMEKALETTAQAAKRPDTPSVIPQGGYGPGGVRY